MESPNQHRAEIEHLLQQADALELTTQARVRLECALHYYAHGENASVTARRFGISRTTFYQWLRKANLLDPAALENRSTAPKRVPQPATDARTIELIRAYRAAQPLANKERVAELLRAEHGIDLSASTVGRVIQRNRLYFADTAAHRAKRGEDNDVQGDAKGTIAAGILAAGASIVWSAPRAEALEGSAYQLNTTYPDQGAGTLDGSTYTVKNGSLTDADRTLQGSTYRINATITDTTASSTPTSSASSESSATSERSSAQASPAADGDDTPSFDGGGRRPIPLPASASTSSAARPTPSSVSSASVAESSASESADATVVPASSSADISYDDTVRADAETSTPHPAAPDEPFFDYGATSEQWDVFPIQNDTSDIAPITASPWILAPLAAAILFGCIAWAVSALPRAALLALLRSVVRTASIVLLGIATLVAILWGVARANAATTAPLNHWYQGQLLDSDGEPVTTAVTIRMSYWKSADFTASDLTATGSLNTSATNYAGWYEEHTVTPDDDGSFAVELGSVRALPDFAALPTSTLTSLFLQVDVKASGAADSTYDLLDSNGSSTTVDRTSVLSLPFARNADLLDQRDVGTSSGSIPVLTAGASLGLGGNLGINNDNEAADAVLTFGNSILAETLQFAIATGRFEFSDDVHVAGHLTASGGLTVSGSTAIRGTLTGNRIAGFNLSTCQGSTSKLTYDASTGTFGCGTDVDTDTDTDTTYSAGQGLALNGTSLSLSSAFTGTSVEIAGTASGTHVHAEQTLTSSGTFVAEGNLTFGGAIGDAVTVNAGAWTFANDTTFTINGGAGTLEVVGTLSGSLVHGNRVLRSSGTILAESGAYIDGTTLVVQAGSDRVGVGTADPKTTLDVRGTVSGSLIGVGNFPTTPSIAYASGQTLRPMAAGSSGQLLVSQGGAPPAWRPATTTSSMLWYINTLVVTGTGGAVVPLPYDFTPTSVDLRVKGAPQGAAIVIDIRANGASIFSAKPQIDAGTTTGGGSAVISSGDIGAGTVLTVGIDQVGSTLAGSGLTVLLRGTRDL